MKYSEKEVMQFVQETDVKFIRLAFCDVYGRQKNVSIMPGELERAFRDGIAVDASAISGFGGQVRSDLFLRPDPATLAGLPWRPENGRVVRMFCAVTDIAGNAAQADTRHLLKLAVEDAERDGCAFSFGAEMEFYLFKTDDEGRPTREPHDDAGYMDIAPEDKGENVRREICLTLERMGIQPEASHHEEGPGQNEIDFRYSDPLTAADNAVTFCSVVRTVAARNGLYADFSPKPLADQPGSGFHINLSVQRERREAEADPLDLVIAGILDKACEMTAFFNPCEASYERLGGQKAPRYVSWSGANRSQLIRLPAAVGAYRRAELRSPDPSANPYVAFALLIRAGLHGIKHGLSLPAAADFNAYTAQPEILKEYQKLPSSWEEAKAAAARSEFIRRNLPAAVRAAYCGE